jgi:PKHD-type hydroxylase
MITQLLNEERVARVRSWLDSTDYWSDGIHSLMENNPGDGEVYKANLELDRGHEGHVQPSQIIYRALDRSTDFYNLCLPVKTSNIIFSRTSEGGFYKPHFDDYKLGQYSNTVFLSDPSEYDGGELTLWLNGKEERFKLKPGMMITYTSGVSHQVEKVTRGTREVAVFWTESEIKDDRLRNIIGDLYRCHNLLGSVPVLDSVKETQNDPRFLLSQIIHNIMRYNQK